MVESLYNLPLLRSELRRLALCIRDLKRVYKGPGHKITRDEFQRINDLKKEYTILCEIRARSRGLKHVKMGTESLVFEKAIKSHKTRFILAIQGSEAFLGSRRGRYLVWKRLAN